MDLSQRIRAAAKKQKLTLEGLRAKSGIPNGTFYNLLAGNPPRVFRTIERLRDAGVKIPRDILAA